MRWGDFALFDDAGLSLYEKKSLVTLMIFGIADAGTICRESKIPTSKIYRAMEKLADMGLVRIQPTRPKLYSAILADEVAGRLVAMAREKAENFAKQAEDLRLTLASLPKRLRSHTTFVDVALGMESHVKKHLLELTNAKKRILSYLEEGDLKAFAWATHEGFPLLQRMTHNKIDHRMIFGFDYASAPNLIDFLRMHSNCLTHITGVRYSGELGHPFHVIDDTMVILPLDHPFIAEGRFASLLFRDQELAEQLSSGFEGLWHKAMRDLREINFQPLSTKRK